MFCTLFPLLKFSVAISMINDHLCKLITDNRVLLPAEEMRLREHNPERRDAAIPEKDTLIHPMTKLLC